MSDDRPYYRRRSTGAVVQLLRTDTHETGPTVCYLRTGVGLKLHVCTEEVLEKEYELLHNDDPSADLLTLSLHEEVSSLRAALEEEKQKTAGQAELIEYYRERDPPAQRRASSQKLKDVQAALDTETKRHAGTKARLKALREEMALLKSAGKAKGVMLVSAHEAALARALETHTRRLNVALDAAHRWERKYHDAEREKHDFRREAQALDAELREAEAADPEGYGPMVHQHLARLKARTRKDVLNLSAVSWKPLIAKIAGRIGDGEEDPSNSGTDAGTEAAP